MKRNGQTWLLLGAVAATITGLVVWDRSSEDEETDDGDDWLPPLVEDGQARTPGTVLIEWPQELPLPRYKAEPEDT